VTTRRDWGVNKFSTNRPSIGSHLLDMVRRIIIDSDFDSGDEAVASNIPQVSTPVSERRSRIPEPTTSPVQTKNGQQSVRRVVRQIDIESCSEASFTVDSDIWTEESSIGSFIVHTDEFSEDETNDNDSGQSQFHFSTI
jgi:hypothetical protein